MSMGKRQFAAGPMSKALGKVIRNSLRITEIELARRVEVSQDTVSRWLNGRRPIDIENLAKICESAELDLLELVSLAQTELDKSDDDSENGSPEQKQKPAYKSPPPKKK